MTPGAARRLLRRHSPPDENWPLHSRQVARVARLLAEAVTDRGAGRVAPAEVEVQGLLHDIGRCRTHGPLHGWSGYLFLKGMGHAREGRGCLTHWLKGRTQQETEAAGGLPPEFVRRVYAELDPPDWELADCVLSVADASVRHSTIVPMDERHADLRRRYGESAWLQRAAELDAEHAARIEQAAGVPLDELLGPLHGDCLEAPEPGS